MEKSNAKLDRNARSVALGDGINDMQSRALQLMFGVDRDSNESSNGEGEMM